MKGIYQYKDLKTGDVVYVGKDSNIEKNTRRKAHLNPSYYDGQPFNRVLQNNPDRYEYSVLWSVADCSTLKLNKMEILFGKIFNPKFNFDKFGKGGCIKHSEETKQKMSKSHKGKTLSEETKNKIGKANKGKTHSEESKRKLSKAHEGKKHSEESKMNMSKAKNSTGYFRISKQKCKTCKRGFRYVYSYYDENGEQKAITSINIKELERKVKEKDLLWYKFDGED